MEQNNKKPGATETFEEPYDSIYDAQGNNYPVLQRIWAEVYGDDYPADADPDPTNFITLTDLERIAHELQIKSGQTAADLGCGRGKFTLWMAKKTGAGFVGVDISDEAVRYAGGLAISMGIGHNVRFRSGTFAASRLADSSIDGAVSTDALMFAPDIPAACQETARILRSGARFIFTSWEMSKPSPSLRLPAIHDYRPILAEAGFNVEIYEETPDWKVRQRAVLAGIAGARDQLVEEMGEAAAMPLYQWALIRPDELDHNRRVLAVARKK
jgi:SAM-dependent methyltransferase